MFVPEMEIYYQDLPMLVKYPALMMPRYLNRMLVQARKPREQRSELPGTR